MALKTRSAAVSKTRRSARNCPKRPERDRLAARFWTAVTESAKSPLWLGSRRHHSANPTCSAHPKAATPLRCVAAVQDDGAADSQCAERGQPCPRETKFPNPRTRLSALLSFDVSWSQNMRNRESSPSSIS